VLQDLSEQRIMVAHSLDALGNELDLQKGVYHLIWEMDVPLKAGTYQIIAGASGDGMVDEWIAQPCLVVLPNLNTHLPEQWHGLINQEFGFGIERMAD